MQWPAVDPSWWRAEGEPSIGCGDVLQERRGVDLGHRLPRFAGEREQQGRRAGDGHVDVPGTAVASLGCQRQERSAGAHGSRSD